MSFDNYMKNWYVSYNKNPYPIDWRTWKLMFFRKRNDGLSNKIKNLKYIIKYNKNLNLNFSKSSINMNDKPDNPNEDKKNKYNNLDLPVTKYNPFTSPNTIDNINTKCSSATEKSLRPRNNQLQSISYNPLYSGIITENNIILSDFFIPSMGFCIYDFNCLSSKTHLDGTIYVNLNDIISIDILKGYFLRDKYILNLNHVFKEYKDLMNALFYLQLGNIQIIFYLDMIEIFCSYLLINISAIEKTVESFKKKLNKFLNIFMDWGGYSFLEDKITTDRLYNNSSYFNYIVSYQKDTFQLINDGVFSLVNQYINYNIKYLSTKYNDFVFLCGKHHNLDFKNLSNPNNETFISSINNDIMLISFDYLLENKLYKNDKTSYNLNKKKVFHSLYTKEFITIETMTNTHKETVKKLYNEHYDEMNTAIQNILRYELEKDNTDNIIIGMNLHHIFDKQMIEHLTYLWENYLVNNVVLGEGKNDNLLINGSQYKEHIIEFKIDNLMDLFNGKMLEYTNIDTPSKSECDNDKSKPTTPKDDIKNPFDMNPVPLDKLNSQDSQRIKIINFNIPSYSTEFNINKCKLLQQIKFNKKNNDNTIYIITGTSLTFEYFQKIYNEIVNNEGIYNSPKNLRGSFIDFSINPMLRINMGYENYISNFKLINNSFVTKKYYTNSVMYRGFNRFVKIAKQENKKNKTQYNKYKKDSLQQCCKCCKCSSKLNIDYFEWKYLPIWSEDIYEKILNDELFWCLRY
jgi:hypothetical protein